MTRASTAVPFFNQLITDPAPWDVYPIHYTLKSNMTVYEMRYSSDILERHSLWSFDSQAIHDTWHNESEMQLRYAALTAYCTDKNIVFEESITEMTESEFDDFKTKIVKDTWPTESFNLCLIPGIGQDEFLGDLSNKPSNETWNIHPWFVNL
jgi:hypothetical protein